MKDVYAAMNIAALATENMHIGSAVTNLLTRHPTVTANATAALDELSNGHAMLGLGRWSAVYGAGYTPSKLGDLSASIGEFRQLFTGEEQELYGTKVGSPRNARSRSTWRCPSSGLLRLCGQKCDGAVLMGAADPEFVNWQLEFIYEGLEKAGRDRKDLTIDLVVTMSADDDEEKALSDVRAWATSQAATFDVWKRMPPAWERFRPEFAAANSSYHLVDHLSRHAGHKQVVSDEFRVKSVALAAPSTTAWPG